MSFPRIAAITLAVLLISDLAAEAAGPLRPFKHGFWSGGAYTDDHTGAFTHCSAGVAYDSGIDLFMLVTGSYRWWLGFINPQWSLTANKKTPVRLQLDKAEPLERSATVPSGQLVLVPLPESARLLEEFRHSTELTLTAQGRSFFFKLGDTAAVMDELTGCVRSSAALDAHSAPPASAALDAHSAPPAPVAQPSTTADSPGSTGSASASSASRTGLAAADSSATRPSHSKPAANAAEVIAAATQPAPATEPTPDRAAAGEGTPTAAGNPAVAPPAAAASPPPSAPGATIGSAPGNSESADGTAAAGSGGGASFDGLRAPAQSPPAQPASEATLSLPPASPPLSFTSVPSEKSALPASAIGSVPHAPSPSSFGPPEAASPTEREEMRLAKEFLVKAQLPNARLVFTDKPPALASFAAVWQADDAAGAVKIIPPGPQVSAISIASNLIAVDPQVCKGNFATARSSASFDKGVVFSAVLSCTEANERRTTRYLVAQRPKGGFVVFAVISGAAGGSAPPVRQEIDLLSKAAVEAAENQG